MACDQTIWAPSILKNNFWVIQTWHQLFLNNKISKDKNKVIKISLQWKINRKWVITKTQVKSIKLMTVRDLVRLNKSSILVLVVRIRVRLICIIRIVNNSSFFNLISLPIKRLGQIQEAMFMKHPVVINNFRRQESTNWNRLVDTWAA